MDDVEGATAVAEPETETRQKVGEPSDWISELNLSPGQEKLVRSLPDVSQQKSLAERYARKPEVSQPPAARAEIIPPFIAGAAQTDKSNMKDLLGLKLPVTIVNIDEINHTAERLIGDKKVTVLHAASGALAGYGAAIDLLQHIKDWYGSELVDNNVTVAIERTDQEAHYSSLADKLARRKYAEDPNHHFYAGKTDDMYNAELAFQKWADGGSFGTTPGKTGTKHKILIENVASPARVEGDKQASEVDLSDTVHRDNVVLDRVAEIPGKVLLILLDDADRQVEMKRYGKTRIDTLLHDKDANLAKFEVKRDLKK